MKKLTLIILALGLALGARAQNIVAGVEFETRFDNREYTSCDFGESSTLFGFGFSPEAGIEWAEKNRLMVGMNLTHDFGDENGISSVELMVYYQFSHPNWQVNAGIFPRSKMMGSYSEAFFDDRTTFYHDPLQGLLAFWRSTESDSYAEFLIDWEGLRSKTQREKFRILAEGRWDNSRFYAGSSLMMLHYAKTLEERSDEGVVDNLLVNPHVGMRLKGNWHFEARLGYLQALQRDRITESGWITPKGGELHLSLARWGFELSNRLYIGENLLPLYGRYGEDLYEASTFYGTTEKIYNRTALSYGRTFFKDTLSVEAALVAHYDGVGMGLQQVLKIGVNFEKVFSTRK